MEQLRAKFTHPRLIDFAALYSGLDAHFRTPALHAWLEQLPEQIATGLNLARWGDMLVWLEHWAALPDQKPEHVDFSTPAISLSHSETLPTEFTHALYSALMGLHPWRKGPFQFFDVYVDTEWRSNIKWARIAPHLDLRDKRVLDVGCGNGYYGWRMLGAGARSVIGIDPSPRFVVQWGCVRRYCSDASCFVLPIGVESLPESLNHFDVTFSMGVLYHRKSPFDHLLQLKDTLRPGGKLVLETLIIPGADGETLLPTTRYGKMRNVWLIPTMATLTSWLARCGFSDITRINESQTTVHEQRQTPWMRYESLADFLDPQDSTLTIEGYPAPTRAIVIAHRPLSS